MMKRLLLSLGVVLGLLLTACAPEPAARTDRETTEVTEATDPEATEPEATDPAETGTATEVPAATEETPVTDTETQDATPTDDAGDLADLAMVLPGTIQDADYNAVAHEALQTIAEERGIETAFSESVAVVDAERVAREYIDSGFGIVAFHGGQYLTIGLELAEEFPDTEFIVESSGELDSQPENVWNIGRLFYPGYYVLGVLAAEATTTGTVAFLGGIDIPDYKAGANAMFEGARSVDPEVELLFTFTGDQNDAVAGRQAAEALINQGADVLVLGVNNAIYGVAEAATNAADPVLVTSLFTDKRSLAEELFLTSMIFDFTGTYLEVLDEIAAGTTTGYIEMRPGSGVTLSEVYNVSDEVRSEVESAFAAVAEGTVEIEPQADEVTVP